MERYVPFKEETIDAEDDKMAYSMKTEYWDNLIKTSDNPSVMKAYVMWVRAKGDLDPGSSTLLNDYMKEMNISQEDYAMLKHETEKTPYKNEV